MSLFRPLSRPLPRSARLGLGGLALALLLVACGRDQALQPVTPAQADPAAPVRVERVALLQRGPFGVPLRGPQRAAGPGGNELLLIEGAGFEPGMVVWLGQYMVYADRVNVSADGRRIICWTPPTQAGSTFDVGVGRTDDFGEEVLQRAVAPGALHTSGLGQTGLVLLGVGIAVVALLGIPLYAVIAAVTCLGLFAGSQTDPLRGFFLARDPLSPGLVPGQGANLVATWVGSMGESPLWVAIALLTYAGTLLSESRAPTRIVNLARALVGWLPGGLALVAILACCLFTIFTGASGVTIIALGGLLLPLLLREGYPERFTLGLLTTGGSLGLLFYPCLPVLVYGYVTRLNVNRLYAAAWIPGLLLIGILFALSVVVALTRKVPRHKFDLKELGRSARAAAWEIPLPVVTIGGWRLGLFTPSDLAVITAAYLTITLVFVHGDVPPRQFLSVVRKGAVLIGAILLIVGMSLGFGNWVSLIGVPQMILGAMQEYVTDRLTFLVVLNLFLLVVGCLLDIFSATLIVVPLITPVAAHFGVDPYHLAVVFLVNLEIGYSTPPVGINLFLASLRFRRPVVEMYRASLLFIGVLMVALIVLTWVPAISLAPFDELPRIELPAPHSLTVQQGEEVTISPSRVGLGEETEASASEQVTRAEESLTAEEGRLGARWAELDAEVTRLERELEDGLGDRGTLRDQLRLATKARAPLVAAHERLERARDLLQRIQKLAREVTWRSRLDGSEESGATFSTGSLVPGTHLLTATARDEHGHLAQAAVTVVVTPAPPGQDDDGWDDGDGGDGPR